MADLRPTSPTRALRTIFLDRDGVLNRKMPEGHYVTSVSDLHILPGVPAAVRQFNEAGLRVLVVSNQRGIALGLYTAADVHKIHASLQATLQSNGAHIDAFYFCPHDRQQCNCRKPLPGLYEQAFADFPDITPESSAMIGDSWSDIEFGRRLGMRTIFLEGDAQHRKPGADEARALADLALPALPEATNALLAGLIPATTL